MTKNFVNYHILISHSPSCLNRDDMNMQKTAVFGGKRRVRYTSQSLKRTMRMGEYYKNNIGKPSIRSKHIDNPDPNSDSLKQRIVEALKGRYDEDTVVKTLELLSGKTLTAEGVTEGDSVAPWVVEEVAWFCENVKFDKDLDPKKLAKELKKDAAAFLKTLENGMDIALSGRMATSGLLSEVGKIDGALAVAHPITTHVVDSEIDWFTAVDDLQELGSGHLDTQEFSSGVFYRYASLNISQLQENLGGASRERALEIAAHLLHMLATEVPSAKQQSFAAHNLADLALVTLSDIPVSLANAFEAPVKAQSEGLIRPSIKALHDFWQNTAKVYELNDLCAEFSLHSSETPSGVTKKETLSTVKEWIKNDGKDM